MSDCKQLIEQTLRRYVRPDTQVVGASSQPLQETERGYSGARLERHRVIYRTSQDGRREITLITKEASLVERRVLNLLNGRGCCVPFSHTLDLTTDRPALVCQEDLGGDTSASSPPEELIRQVARCLARIHYANLGQRDAVGWLPRADGAYFETHILTDFRHHLAGAMKHPEFLAAYGGVAQQMEEATGPFLSAMTMLWDEESTLTLIHADMMDSHILVHDGCPYIIDWGQARYGSLYLDLPNYFTPDNALFYRDALAELGVDIPVGKFMQRYREAGRYPGFKYMGFLLSLWLNGRLPSLHGPLLNQLLHGKVYSS